MAAPTRPIQTIHLNLMRCGRETSYVSSRPFAYKTCCAVAVSCLRTMTTGVSAAGRTRRQKYNRIKEAGQKSYSCFYCRKERHHHHWRCNVILCLVSSMWEVDTRPRWYFFARTLQRLATCCVRLRPRSSNTTSATNS